MVFPKFNICCPWLAYYCYIELFHFQQLFQSIYNMPFLHCIKDFNIFHLLYPGLPGKVINRRCEPMKFIVIFKAFLLVQKIAEEESL